MVVALNTRIAAAILAGGQAKRFHGIPKGLLPVGVLAPPADSVRIETVPHDEHLRTGVTSGQSPNASEPGCTGELSIISRLAGECLRAGIDEVTLFTNTPDPYHGFEKIVCPDIHPGVGPLGGIETALIHYHDYKAVLILPCDLPAITSEVIRTMLHVFGSTGAPVVVAENHLFLWEPLCAIVHTEAVSRISNAIAGGERRVMTVWKQLGVQSVRFADPDLFWNINSSEDLAAWQQHAHGDVG